MEGDTDKAAGAQVVMSKTMRELEAIKNELRFDYNPAKVEKIIAKLNEIIKTHPAGSPEAERAAFELAGVQIKKKDFSNALKTLETLKNLKSNAVNDSDVKNLVDYAAVMNKKKNAALMTFEKNIKNSANIFQWLRGKDPLDKNVMRFFSLDTLVSQLKDRITILGLARGDWKNNFENPIGTRNPNVAQKTIRTLLSLKTVFPRDGNDNLIFFAANRNYRMWSVLTAMCGGRVEGLKPLAPNSVTRR